MSESDIPARLAAIFDTDSLAGLGPLRRPDALSEADVREQAAEAMTDADTPVATRDLILSAALLWHDHLDASHTVSQDLPCPSGSFLHGIMHRREPDYSNAKYWFHRTGVHPVFPDIAARAAAFLDEVGDPELRDLLIRNDKWDSFGMVDACAAAERGRLSPSQADLLKFVQQIEIQTLVESFCRGEG